MGFSEPGHAPIDSPCIGVCTLDERGLCIGCQRSVDEIGRWLEMTDEERAQTMQILHRRKPEDC